MEPSSAQSEKMVYRKFNLIDLEVSAIGLGTWVMGGWLWGGAEDKESEAACEAALQAGINLVDTAPVYGFGRSEKVVGRVIKRLNIRDQVVIATKCGLDWNEKTQRIWRDSRRVRILKEIDESRKRLDTDVIDLYQVHWPDVKTNFHETMETLLHLQAKGRVRAIGLSNFNVEQMQACMEVGPFQSLQPPYNLFERNIEDEILPFCREYGIHVLAYGSICRGLLSGKFSEDKTFPASDVRNSDPKFQKENFHKYLAAVKRLAGLAETKKAKLSQVAARWVAEQPGVTCALVGSRTPVQAMINAGAFGFDLSGDDMASMERWISEEAPSSSPKLFGGPPLRD